MVTKLSILGTALLLTPNLSAGTSTLLPEKAQTNTGDFCKFLKDFGTLYKDKNNPYIQEIRLSARFHGQYAYVDGSDINGQKFNHDFEEIRRLRAGLRVKAFNNFEFKAVANLEDDGNPTGGPRQIGYEDFDQFLLSYELENTFGWDSLQLAYGRQKFRIGAEAHTSSRRIKTVERSALTNKIYDNRYTSFSLSAQKGGFEGRIGLLSLDESNFIGNWDAGTAFYFNTKLEALHGEVTLDFLYNFDQGTSDDQIEVGYRWATSLAWEGEIAGWDVMVNAVVGDNGTNSRSEREGTFYGFIVMPSKFIIQDKLEFVTRYQFQGSDEQEGIRLNTRYVRRAELGSTDLDGGRGDAHHSIYAGLNYHFCGHRSKVMAGVEYETLNGMNGDVDATTLWLAYRVYF